MSKVADLHEMWNRAPEYRKACDLLGPEFELSRSVIVVARTNATLTQAQLAERMETTQSIVTRLESGRTHPYTKTLDKNALASGTRLQNSFEPTG